MIQIKKGLSIVIPVYNSSEMLPQLVSRLESVFKGLGKEFEILLINDGSRDNSWAVIERLATQHSCLKGICMMRNYGQHNALLAGILAAQYDVTITMDDDLQHPPEELPKLIAALTPEFDVVYAPPLQEQHGFLRDVWRRLSPKRRYKGRWGRKLPKKVARGESSEPKCARLLPTTGVHWPVWMPS